MVLLRLKNNSACGKFLKLVCPCRSLNVNLFVVGKRSGGEPWIADGCFEYEKRLKPIMSIQTTFFKDDDGLIRAAQSNKCPIIALDENGRQCTSHEFTDLLYKTLGEGGASTTFIIGGFAGLPKEIKSTHKLVSLSKMTWTHSMARLLLMEQIYRATEIKKGSKYHQE